MRPVRDLMEDGAFVVSGCIAILNACVGRLLRHLIIDEEFLDLGASQLKYEPKI